MFKPHHMWQEYSYTIAEYIKKADKKFDKTKKK